MSANAKLACAEIVAAFAHYIDHREFDRAVALFSEDAAFLRPDLEARGRAEIATIWAGRPASVVTKHLCGIPVFTEVTPDRITSVTPFMLYTLNHEGEGLPVFDRPAAIAEFQDVFRLTEQGWRIAERRGVPLMVAG